MGVGGGWGWVRSASERSSDSIYRKAICPLENSQRKICRTKHYRKSTILVVLLLLCYWSYCRNIYSSVKQIRRYYWTARFISLSPRSSSATLSLCWSSAANHTAFLKYTFSFFAMDMSIHYLHTFCLGIDRHAAPPGTSTHKKVRAERPALLFGFGPSVASPLSTTDSLSASAWYYAINLWGRRRKNSHTPSIDQAVIGNETPILELINIYIQYENTRQYKNHMIYARANARSFNFRDEFNAPNCITWYCWTEHLCRDEASISRCFRRRGDDMPWICTAYEAEGWNNFLRPCSQQSNVLDKIDMCPLRYENCFHSICVLSRVSSLDDVVSSCRLLLCYGQMKSWLNDTDKIPVSSISVDHDVLQTFHVCDPIKLLCRILSVRVEVSVTFYSSPRV